MSLQKIDRNCLESIYIAAVVELTLAKRTINNCGIADFPRKDEMFDSDQL